MGDARLIKKDEELASLVQKGQINAFEELLLRYEKKIIRYARKFFSDNEEIKDIVQEIFLKTYRNIKSFDSNRKFSTWLYAIAHNELVNHLKKIRRWPLISVDADTFWPAVPDKGNLFENILKEEERKSIEECLDQLPVKYREIMVLFYFEDLDYSAISDILKIPTNTVGVRLKRAREKMKIICNK